MHGLEMHLMVCYVNEFWIYLHICSIFKSILLYRVNKIMFTAIPIQFIFRPSDRVHCKKANCAKFAAQIMRLERPIMR